MSRFRSLWTAIVLGGTCAAPQPAHAFIEGMVVSCPMNGEIWGSPAMQASVAELADLGVEWIQIHPYARIRTDGTVEFHDPRTRESLRRGLAYIRKGGLQTFLKPHLAYWGAFSWRGAIRFASDAEWARFFDGYQRWIVAHAELAQEFGVPALSIGTELDATLDHADEWRAIIAAVRAVYDGHITYAANWDRVTRVPFWDAVDAIGVQAYFPVGPADAARDVIVEGWRAPLAVLGGLAKGLDKPVVFTEVGYALSRDAPREPWVPKVDRSAEASEVRARLTEVILNEMPKHDFIAGVFFWKWIPGRTWFQNDFSMRDPAMRSLIAHAWSERRP